MIYPQEAGLIYLQGTWIISLIDYYNREEKQAGLFFI